MQDPINYPDYSNVDWAGKASSMLKGLFSYSDSNALGFAPASNMPDLAPAGQYYVYPDGNMSNLKGPGAIGPFTQAEAQSKAFTIKGGTAGTAGTTGTAGTGVSSGIATGLEPILGSFSSQKGQAGIVAEDSQMGYPSWMTSYQNTTQNWQDLWG